MNNTTEWYDKDRQRTVTTPNANTVMDVVVEDLKCCGNCAHMKDCRTEGWQSCDGWMSDNFDKSMRAYKQCMSHYAICE